MSRVRLVAVTAVILLAGGAAAASGHDRLIESHASVDGALINEVNLTQAARSGRLTAANCQLLVAGSVFVGAFAAADALAVIANETNVTTPFASLGLREELREYSNSSSSCAHDVQALLIRVQEAPGWGEPPTAEGETFWWKGAHDYALGGNLTLNATGELADVAVNNATVHILSGSGNAATSCQLLVAARVTVFAFSSSTAIPGPATAEAQSVPPPQPEPARAAPGEGSATCRQHVGDARIEIPT